MKANGVLLGSLVCVSSLISNSVNAHAATHEPLPVKKKFVINDVSALETLWNGLSEPEKKLAYHLQNAGRAGRDLLFFQSHRHALVMKSTFETATNQKNFENTRHTIFGDTPQGKAAFNEFLTYVGMFEDQNGPYLNANRKVVLSQVTPEQVEALFKTYSTASAETIKDVQLLLTDKQYEVIRRPEDPKGSDLMFSGGNIYQYGITGPEMESALAQGLQIDLNCQVIKDLTTGAISCLKMTTQTEGFVGETMRKVVRELELALPYALTAHQKAEIESFVQYFRTGDKADFRQADIEWVRDRTDSKIDFQMGFVEVYEDYKGNVGSWETMIQFVDPATTQQSKKLATHAQYFENQMPYGTWKKQFPADYSPPAMMVYYFLESASMHTGGYNLPNFDDLRNDPTVGAKNVIRLPLPGEMERPQTKAKFVEYFSALGPASRAEELASKYALQRKVIVLLHEIIGHGSGTYDVTRYAEKEDPISALGAAGSALEEERADLAALVFAGDHKLVEIGIYKSDEEALSTRNAMYDIYMIDFLGWLVRQRTLSESHSRGHWLLVHHLMEKGAVEWENGTDPSQPATPDNQVLVVKDYNKFWTVCRDLLGELQDIKALRKKDRLEKLMADEAPLGAINEPWAQAVIHRGEDLKLNYATFDQAWTISPDLKFQTLSDTTLEGFIQGLNKQGYQE